MAQRLGSSGAAILVPELTSRCKLTKPFCACCSSFDFVESMSRLVFSELQASSAFQETEKEQAADVTSIGVGHHFTVLSYVNAFWTNSHIRKQTAHIAIFTTSLIHRIVTCKNLLSRQLITLLFSPVTRHHDGRIHKDMLTTTIYVAGGSLNEKRLPRLIRMNLAVSRGPRKKERTISHLTPQSLSVKIPRTWDLAKFAIPTLGIWLSNPILSLVDSAIVGGFCNPEDLAALSPGSVVCDSSAYIFMFLAVATTNLYATALSQGNSQKAANVVRQSLSLALACGIILATSIHFFAPVFLTAFTGAAAGPGVLAGAMQYAAIRAWGSPAALLTNVAQAACFGGKDAVTPLRAVLIAGALNWAALATVAAQYAGLTYILYALKRRQESLLGTRFTSILKLLGLPNKQEFKEFLSFAGPAFFALFGKVVSISMMTYAASGAGTLSLAAHQVVMQVFFFFCKFGDSVSSTAQTFLPGAFAAGDRTVVLAIIRRCMLMAFFLGIVDSLLAGAVPLYCARIFTKDAAVAAHMASITPMLCFSLLFHATVMALEGVLFACRKMKFLAGSYIVTTCGFTAVMYVARGQGIGLSGVWMALFALRTGTGTYYFEGDISA